MLKLSINSMDEYVMSKLCYVYWYHLSKDEDVYTHGYVGITTNLAHRHYHHKTGRTNAHLANAFKLYGENEIVKTILMEGTIEACLEREVLLRPTHNIGWNIEPGGGSAPDCTGLTHSQETKDKISRGNLGKNTGRTSPFKGLTDRYSKETRELIGSYHVGKAISAEHRARITECNSGVNHFRSIPTSMVHKDNPSDIKVFANMREAAEKLGLNYPALRSQKRKGTTAYNRKGWKILR